MLWDGDEEEGNKISDRYRCQPYPGIYGKGGEQQLHLSCVNAVNSIYCEEMLFVPCLMNKFYGLHLL